jgi:hypothetical protein
MTRERDGIIAPATAVGIRVSMAVGNTRPSWSPPPDSLSGKTKKDLWSDFGYLHRQLGRALPVQCGHGD